MWWGIAIEAPDPGALSAFYSQLLGWTIGQQRPMMHFDFQVGDLDFAVAEALALGATVAEHQPQAHLRVLFDPAGHPFCLCLDDEMVG